MRRAAIPIVVLLAVGCGGTIGAEARVMQPAVVPVRAFPRVLVASGHLSEEIAVIDALARHLRRGRHVDARRLHVSELEPLREAGRIRPATAVIIATVVMTERMRPEWTTRPEVVCGPSPGPCYETSRPHLYDVPTLAGRLHLTVYDGPTARVMQRVVVRSADEGRDYESMRRTVLSRLIRRAKQLVDQRVLRREVDLLSVDDEGAARALGRIEAGDWHGGRIALERIAASPRAARLPPTERARLLYDLGQARRFDAGAHDLDDARFVAAEQALREAMRLDPQRIYARALGELAAHRRAVALVREQREAARYNFEIGRELPRVPQPPPSYR